MTKIIRFILNIMGGLMIGIFVHEAYHYFTMDKVVRVCHEVGSENMFAVYGYGSSSEFVAYAITFFIVIVSGIFAAYDLFTER